MKSKTPLTENLIQDWHPTKNLPLLVTDISAGVSKKVWWLGKECHHEWEGIVSERSNGRGCQVCSGKKILEGYNDLATINPELALEWHPTKNNDLLPSSISPKSVKKVWWMGKNCGHSWISMVGDRNRGQGCAVCSGVQIEIGFNDFSTTHPEVAAEWHPTKNNDITADQVTAGIAKKVWWLGKECGHEWEAAINSRAKGGNCTVCSGWTILVGFNDLASQRPDIASEWHPAKNALEPTEITLGSNKKIWWMGKECGHEWIAAVANRVYGRNCPVCSGKQVLSGFNDIKTLKPLVAQQWNHTKNLPLLLEETNAGSNLSVWWENKVCGHEWQMAVSTRTDNVLCSVCEGHTLLAGFNDLATTHPELAKEWDNEANLPLTPATITVGSSKKVWWVGKECGHKWNMSIRNRIREGGGNCSVCRGRAVLVGFNDFASQEPELLKEWHPTKNLPLSPQEITCGVRNTVWWQCKDNHEWEAAVYSRSLGKHQCPYCTGRNVIPGVNDLVTTHPHLALQWHPTKNLPLLPNQVKGYTAKNVRWICSKNHEWNSLIGGRTRGQGCPTCASHATTSKAEQEINEFLTQSGLTVERSNRSVLNGSELDMYIPSHNFAIEYNGVYWHSEKFIKDKNYHRNKWLRCQEKGIHLIQIWEDEWNKNPDQIKAMLLHKLGLTQQEKVFARKTKVVELTKSDVENFLEQNHIQGYAAGSYYFGLKDKVSGELVSVIILKKERDSTLNIIRYATNKNVIGGFTKLLKYAEISLKPAKFITFSDNCISDGGLYKNNGFMLDKELSPDYRYVIKAQRKHKFGYRLKRFKDDPDLKWADGLTEKELAALNGIPRIWDAGKIRWIKHVYHV